MTRGIRTALATTAVLLFFEVGSTHWSQGANAQAPSKIEGPAPSRVEGPALIDQYCMSCHSDRLKSGGLALSTLNLDAPTENAQSAEVAEKVIRKLRGGLMPPASARHPEAHATTEFVSWLENKIDTATTETKPGRVALRRLNRREYGYAIRDLLGFDIDATAWLPDDNIKGNFDNNAAALQVSPNFVDQYVYAARAVALEAIGNPKALAETTTYGDVANMVISLPPQGAPGTGRQQHHIEGMPFGTRGGFSRRTQLPRRRRIRAHHRRHGARARSAADGVREHRHRAARRQGVLPHEHRRRSRPQGHRPALDPAVEEINGRLRKIRFKATQGQHKLAVTFLHRSFAESDERLRTIALEGGQERIQAAHALQIRGPLSVTGMSESVSRAKIFICQPWQATETACANKIVENLARHAFRRPVTAEDLAAADGVLQVGTRGRRTSTAACAMH